MPGASRPRKLRRFVCGGETPPAGLSNLPGFYFCAVRFSVAISLATTGRTAAAGKA